MRPMNSVSSSSPSSGIKLWKSPIPYLFGSLALMVALMLVALVILVCSYRKRASQSAIAAAEAMKQTMPKNVESNSEPELLVIMAGDDKPTYLAKPITSSNYCICTGKHEELTAYPNETRNCTNIAYLVTMEPTPSSSSTGEEILTS